MSDTKTPHDKKTLDKVNEFIGTYGFILLIAGSTVFFLLISFGLLPTPDFSKYSYIHAWLLAYVLVFPIIIGWFYYYGFMKYFKNQILDFEKQYHSLKDNLAETKTLLNEVKHLGSSGGTLYVLPSDYTNFVELVDRTLFFDSTKRRCGTIFLSGTMVGFSFLLPYSIRNHACKCGTDFKKLKLLATEIDDSWVCYPVFLAAKVVWEMFFSSCKKCMETIERDGHVFEIEITYADIDLPMAAIDLEQESIVVLQALGPKGITKILKHGDIERLRGFRFDKNKYEYEYNRYHMVLDNQWNDYSEKREKWIIERDHNNKIRIRIINPHWSVSKNNQNFVDVADKGSFSIINSGDYDNNSNEIKAGKKDMESFLKNILEIIPSRNNFISGFIETNKEPDSFYQRSIKKNCRDC